ncbi:MAG: Ig-like domain-containing protein, partial [Candidatus Thermoplasmatota archaeon]|nr:Ig-like domain-containing protein [Candidatus Thermoplasmatota archaeon]
MPHEVAKTTSKRNLTTNDLRSIAVGLATAIAIVMLASAMSSDSGSVSATEEMGESSSKSFVSVGVTSVAGDNTVTKDEATAGFTVTGTSDQLSATITATYGGVTDTCTSHASTGAWSCNFQDGAGAGGNMAAVAEGTVAVTASVTVGGSTTTSGNVFATQDTVDPTTPTVTSSTTNDNTPTIAGTFDASDSASFTVVFNSVTYTLSSSSELTNSGDNWALAIGSALNDATYAVVATSTDVNGNDAVDSTNNEIVIDTAITTPTVVTVDTSDTTPTVTGTFDDSDYSTMVVTLNSVTYSAANGGLTVSDDGSDTWSLTVSNANALSDGTYSITATATDSAGNSATDSSSNEVTVDNTAPVATTITMASNNGKNTAYAITGNVITVTMAFNEPINQGTLAVVLDANGNARDATESCSSSTACTATYTVVGGDNQEALDFTITFTDDTTTSPKQTVATAVTGGSTVTIDNTAPSVSVNLGGVADATYKVGDTLGFTLTASEAVDVVTSGGTPQFQLSNNAYAVYSAGSGSTGLTFSYTIAEGNTDSADLSVANQAIAANGGTMTDAAGNAASLTVSFAAGAHAVVVDANSPAFSSVSANDGSYGVGETVAITVTWGEAVAVTGTPQITLSNGKTLSYTSGTGSANLVFSYTVADGDTSSTDGSLAVSSLSLNGGTIRDTAGNDAATSVSGDLGDVLIDGDAADMTGCAATTGDYGVGEALSIVCTWDEAVTVTGTPTVTLDNGDVASYASGSPGTSLTFTTTIVEGDSASSDATVASIQATAGGATMKDAYGGTIDSTIVGGDLGTVTIDGDAPDYSSVSGTDDSYGVGETLSINLVFDETVVVDTTGGVPFIKAGGCTLPYASGTGSATLVFSYVIAEGGCGPAGNSVTDIKVTDFSLNSGTVKDAAGGSATAFTGQTHDPGTINIDDDAPDYSSETSSNDGTYGVGEAITFTVTWDEACVGTSSTLTLSSGASASYTSGSGTTSIVFTYTVAESGSASTTDLTVTGVTGLTDAYGGACADPTYDPGTIQVDSDAPDYSSMSLSAGTYKIGDNVDITIVYDEAVTVTGTPQLTLSNAATASYQSGSTSTNIVFRYTVASGNTDSADITVSSMSLNGGTMKDTAGGDASTSVSGNPAGTAIVDANVPTASTVTMASNNGNTALAKVGDVITLTMVFSEAVGTPTVTIDGNGATEACTSTTQCTATYTMQAGDTAGTVAFTLDFADTATNSGVQVTALTGGSSVTFDEVAPTISVQTVATDGYVNKDEKASFTITGSANGASGQTVTVAYGGVSETGTVAGDGTWSVTMCDDENCASISDGLITVTADVSDTAGNAATQASILASQDTADPTTTISSIDISADTGSSATDFITKTAAQTITATLSASLASGETLQISVNGGSSWANDDHATADGTSVSAAGYTLSGSSSIQMRIVDAASNDGAASSQAYTLDTTAPTLGTVGIATDGSGNSNNGDTITLTFTADEEIQTPTCTISDSGNNALDNSGSMAVNNPSGNTWTCAVTTGDNDANGAVTFSIAYTDVGGTAGNADSTVDDGSSV